MDAECRRVRPSVCLSVWVPLCVRLCPEWTMPWRLLLYQSRQATKLTLGTRAATTQLDDFTVAFRAQRRSPSSIARFSRQTKSTRTNCGPCHCSTRLICSNSTGTSINRRRIRRSSYVDSCHFQATNVAAVAAEKLLFSDKSNEPVAC